MNLPYILPNKSKALAFLIFGNNGRRIPIKNFHGILRILVIHFFQSQLSFQNSSIFYVINNKYFFSGIQVKSSRIETFFSGISSRDVLSWFRGWATWGLAMTTDPIGYLPIILEGQLVIKARKNPKIITFFFFFSVLLVKSSRIETFQRHKFQRCFVVIQRLSHPGSSEDNRTPTPVFTDYTYGQQILKAREKTLNNRI